MTLGVDMKAQSGIPSEEPRHRPIAGAPAPSTGLGPLVLGGADRGAEPTRPRERDTIGATTSTVASPARLGRRPATTRAALEEIALTLFAQDGFDETSVAEIAAAAGIARRTFFRYCTSKTDLVWGDFEAGLERMRRQLHTTDGSVPIAQAIRVAVVDFNWLPPEQVPLHRRRMTLILRVPTLRANSTLRFAQWRQVVAEFAGQRLTVSPESLLPRTLAHCALGAAVAAYECWLEEPASDLAALLDAALRALGAGFAGDGAIS